MATHIFINSSPLGNQFFLPSRWLFVAHSHSPLSSHHMRCWPHSIMFEIKSQYQHILKYLAETISFSIIRQRENKFSFTGWSWLGEGFAILSKLYYPQGIHAES